MSDWPLYLTPEEVIETTGLHQPAAQIRWLQKNGVRHFVRADGKPRVPRRAITDESVTISGRNVLIEPDFDAIRVRQ